MGNKAASRLRDDLADGFRRDVAHAYPYLVIEFRNSAIRVVGPFRLIEDGVEVDRFEVEIVLPEDFPRGLPDVYEVGGRIPRDADHHMYSNGVACLFAPGERWRHWPRGRNLLDFLDGPVRSFFIGHALYELTGEWPFGQRSHGMAGILESYGDLLRISHVPTIIRYIEVLSRRKLRPWSACPCQSGRPIHSCHRQKIADLRGKIWYREARGAFAVVLRGLHHAKEATTK